MKYTIKNTGNLGLAWVVTGSMSTWLSVYPPSGSLGAGQSEDLNVVLTPRANEMAVGSYTGSISIVNTTGVGLETRNIYLAVIEKKVSKLEVTPTNDLLFMGVEGGPFDGYGV
jgi:hypothetical protein